MPCERRHIEAILNQLTAIPDTGDGVSWVAYDNSVKAVMDALAAADESPWRSMESAPKDDTEVLLYFGKGRIEKAVWLDCYGEWVDTREYIKMRNPTHWMPLPAAPEVKP